MITTTIFYLLFISLSVLFVPIKLLPDATLPSEFTSAITTANDYLAGINMILPLNTLLIIFGLFLGIEGTIFIYKFVMWILKKIPTIN